jgi:tetratricopeptide (TPR) repeat protein
MKKVTGAFCATTNASRRCPPPGLSGKRCLSPFSRGMRRARWAIYLWPGLPQAWLRGSWSGLVLALAAAGLVNLALLGSFGWSELIPPGWLGGLWLTLAAAWAAAAAVSFVDIRRRVSRQQAASAADDFERAQDYYLKGDWFQAQRLLGDLLRLAPGDPDARLMLATLMRHTGRLDEAAAQLDLLAQSEGARKWEWEIQRERELLARPRQAVDGQDDGEPGRSPTDPPTEITHAA